MGDIEAFEAALTNSWVHDYNVMTKDTNVTALAIEYWRWERILSDDEFNSLLDTLHEEGYTHTYVTVVDMPLLNAFVKRNNLDVHLVHKTSWILLDICEDWVD